MVNLGAKSQTGSITTMGGKRELRRCISHMDDRQNKSEDLLNQDHRNHATNVCPITIRIESCSDNEAIYDSCKQNSSKSTNQKQPQSHKASPTNERDCLIIPPPSSASPSNSHRSSPNFLDVPEKSDLCLLKATAVRLNLRTRSSSFLEWQAQWLDKSHDPPSFPVPASVETSEKETLTEERKERINSALQWLKTELKEMQSMDQHLARQLLTLRHDIHQLRLRKSCQQHRDLLDDVELELEEQVEFSDVLDLPNVTFHDSPLKQIGVTRMNFSARRFSMC